MDLSVLTDLPDRLDDRRLAAVEYIAQLPVPPVQPVTEPHFIWCMRTLTVLPSGGDDALTAELRIALYRKHFSRFPDAAWSFLVEHATLECRFFPSPAECRAILSRWNRTDGPWRASQLAQARARRERQERLDDLMRRFRMGEVTQDEADHLPERWKRIAATRGFLKEDGTYALRAVAGVREQAGRSPLTMRGRTRRDPKSGPAE